MTFPDRSSASLLDPAPFEGEAGGRRIGLFMLESPGGLRAAVCNHGARLLQLLVPGADGAMRDVVLGHDSLAQLQAGMPSMGAVIGRFANRIAGARFALDGREHRLPANDGPHCLHGGPGGSRHQVFEVVAHESDRLEMAWTFREADDGFPGELALHVTYTLRDPGTLELTWRAWVLGEQATVVNITHHPFFNLEGPDADDALEQRITIDAAHYLPVDPSRIPTGEVAPVDGTAFDLRAGMTLREALAGLPAGAGFDHCYVMAPPAAHARALRRMASACAPRSGVVMQVWADAPGLQFFSCSGMDGSLPRHAGKGGRIHRREAGFCLEPQGLPDAPNQAGFPSAVLAPGQACSGRIEYRFSVAQR